MSEYYLHRSYDCQLSPHASDILDWSSAIHRLNSVYQRYGIENNAHQNQNNSSKKKNRKDNVSYARNTALRNWEYPAERWKVQQNTTQMTQLEELLTKPNHSHSNNSVDTEDTLATTTDELSLKRALPAPINSVHQIIFTSLGDYPFYVRLDKNKKNKNKKQQQEEDTIIKTGVFRMYAGLGLSRVQRNDYFATALAETLKTQIDRNANKNNIEIGYRQLLYVLRVLDVIPTRLLTLQRAREKRIVSLFSQH
ncbi:hypothetical protein ADEAN_000696900 [Angomonas deanei]|uniref:Uncharacterized protein n=1 Tax=Angomonas deanei TaxID=59799 RepID=A0A7G2CKL6_9TRYP|nr:hypothetical protein ADEAN_000696900 [Angomonas deanei]